jgi:hypothetical protein
MRQRSRARKGRRGRRPDLHRIPVLDPAVSPKSAVLQEGDQNGDPVGEEERRRGEGMAEQRELCEEILSDESAALHGIAYDDRLLVPSACPVSGPCEGGEVLYHRP